MKKEWIASGKTIFSKALAKGNRAGMTMIYGKTPTMYSYCAHCNTQTNGSDYCHPITQLRLYICSTCKRATDITYNLNIPFESSIFRILSPDEQIKLISRAPYLTDFLSAPCSTSLPNQSSSPTFPSSEDPLTPLSSSGRSPSSDAPSNTPTTPAFTSTPTTH